MPKSKLELYEDILASLVNKPLTVDAIAYSCGMDCVILRQRLDFLLKNGLVEERTGKKTASFALTNRGLSIYKTLAITHRLKKLQTSIRMIDAAFRTIPALSEYSEEYNKRQ